MIMESRWRKHIKFIGGIPADFRDSTRDDEVLAKQNGYTADQIVEIVACNYSGESFLVDESTGDIYDIKRRFQKNKIHEGAADLSDA